MNHNREPVLRKYRPAVVAAFATVPRERFVGAGPWGVRLAGLRHHVVEYPSGVVRKCAGSLVETTASLVAKR